MSIEQFQSTEREYTRLRGLLTSGRISAAQFAQEIQKMMVQDAQGRYWVLSAETARWLVYDGQSWVEANPYPAAPVPFTAPPAEKKKGVGCGRLLACGCLALVLLVLVAGGGGYYAYKNQLITMNTVLNLVGMGPADIEVDNFRDDTVFVTMTQLNVPEGSTGAYYSMEIRPFDIQTHRFSSPGRFQIDFGTSSAGADLGTCILSLKSGESYQFVPLPDMIVINPQKHAPETGEDLVVATSALCR
jgi:hypothetical protein